eukprot:354386-Chlamydomonas_euryale.AAC.5
MKVAHALACCYRRVEFARALCTCKRCGPWPRSSSSSEHSCAQLPRVIRRWRVHLCIGAAACACAMRMRLVTDMHAPLREAESVLLNLTTQNSARCGSLPSLHTQRGAGWCGCAWFTRLDGAVTWPTPCNNRHHIRNIRATAGATWFHTPGFTHHTTAQHTAGFWSCRSRGACLAAGPQSWRLLGGHAAACPLTARLEISTAHATQLVRPSHGARACWRDPRRASAETWACRSAPWGRAAPVHASFAVCRSHIWTVAVAACGSKYLRLQSEKGRFCAC